VVVETASWIASAQNKDCDFPVQNLPYGVFSTADRSPRCGVAIGDMIVDLAVLAEKGMLGLQFPTALLLRPTLNAFMALGPSAWKFMRVRLTELLRVGGDPALEKNAALHKQALVSLAEATMHLPVEIGG
jgi:fumarylacetoacetase